MEKDRDKSQDGSEDNSCRHKVFLMGSRKEVKLSKGRRVNDLLAEVRKEYANDLKNFRLDHTVSVALNGRPLKMNDNGETEENPVLSHDSVLSLMPQIVGGIS